MIQSGAPVQPLSVSFSGAHMTLISGSTVSSLFIEQFNGKWGRIDLTGAFFETDINIYLCINKIQDFLMHPAGCGHVVYLSVDQFCVDTFGQVFIIIYCIYFGLH